MSDLKESLSDFERKMTNLEENVSDLDGDTSALEENMASQVPNPKFVRIKPKRKPKPSNPPDSPTSPAASKETLSPGETILDVEVSPGLTKKDGFGSYYMGDVRKPDLNSHPAAMGMPTTRTGFYNVTTGTTNVICPLCFQKFTTTTVFENGHLDPGGPCEKFRMKLETSHNTPKKGKGRPKGNGKEIDEAHRSVQSGADHQMDGGNHPIEGNVDQRAFDAGMAHQMTGGLQSVQDGDENQGPYGNETYHGVAMEDVFEGFENVESARNFLGRDLGEGPLHIGEVDRPFALPAGAGDLQDMSQFWAYQGFEGLEGFEESWQYFGAENGSGFLGFGMSGR